MLISSYKPVVGDVTIDTIGGPRLTCGTQCARSYSKDSTEQGQRT